MATRTAKIGRWNLTETCLPGSPSFSGAIIWRLESSDTAARLTFTDGWDGSGFFARIETDDGVEEETYPRDILEMWLEDLGLKLSDIELALEDA